MDGVRKRPVLLGLTGGIGSGKSTVGSQLAGLGAALIDADQIARDATGPGGSAMEAIRASFGPDFVDARGALDRARMRDWVFSRPEARAQLEAIVHPLVTLQSDLLARRAAEEGRAVVVFDIPLLAESGRWARRLDAVLVVDCPEETQVERVIRRSGLAREAVLGIIASQASRPARRAIADAIIANGGNCTLAALHAQTRQVAALFGL
ncbi:dephospho-CoA kinase [Acidovorax sp. M2(2025)]|uniref:dephospho-CoA kinase n=1 Tax=Acidovorax sp. M2(2025) TaxID=3411355 RepID=UPI003BF5A222